MTDLPEKVFVDYDPPRVPLPSQMFTNPVHIPRKLLFEYLTKMRVNYSIFARDHDLHVLEGGMVGQKIILSNAGQFCYQRLLNSNICFQKIYILDQLKKWVNSGSMTGRRKLLVL